MEKEKTDLKHSLNYEEERFSNNKEENKREFCRLLGLQYSATSADIVKKVESLITVDKYENIYGLKAFMLDSGEIEIYASRSEEELIEMCLSMTGYSKEEFLDDVTIKLLSHNDMRDKTVLNESDGTESMLLHEFFKASEPCLLSTTLR